jgi:hypothetical protein
MKLSPHPSFFRLLFFVLVALGCTFSSCQLFWAPKSPKGYVLPRPKKTILEKKVNEISGLNFLPKENAMLAIADNKQKIYRVTPEGEVTDYLEEEFGPEADYEDVVQVDSAFYVLISDGTIVAVNPTDSGIDVKNYPFWSKAKNDFETLYYDSTINSLVMLCKYCKEGDDATEPAAYRFDLAGKRFETTPYYKISSKEVRNSLKDGQVEFKPSAAAVHPLEKRLYILASAGNLLVVTDLKGKVQEVFRLNPTLYPQAEGIAFAPNGDMYVSNEAKLGKPTLLYIAYKPSAKPSR